MNEHTNPMNQPEKVTCLHCGLPIPLHRDDEFCCNGCMNVHELILSSNLEDFYTFRERYSFEDIRPETPRGDSYIYMDDPEFFKTHVKCTESGSTVKLSLEGIHCAGCVWLIEKLPDYLDGVSRARLLFSSGTLIMDFDESKLKLSQIAKTLDSFGYIPHPYFEEKREMNAKRSRLALLKQLGVAGFCAGNLMIVSVALYEGALSGMQQEYEKFFRIVSLILCLPVFLYSARPFFKSSWSALKCRQPHIDIPVSLSLLLTFIISCANVIRGSGEIYFDSFTTLVFLLLVGRWAQTTAMHTARNKTRSSSRAIPYTALREKDSRVEEIPARSIVPGDILLIHEQSRVPADGILLSSHARLDCAVLTGESLPVERFQGSPIEAGGLNTGKSFKMRATTGALDSRIGKLLADVEESGDSISGFSQADKVSSYFVYTILSLSVATLGIVGTYNFSEALDRVVALCVIACPCAIALATPASFVIAVSKAAQSGIFIRSADALEVLASCTNIFFDKTGTLTSGTPKVRDIMFFNSAQKSALAIAASLAENTPSHPVARAVIACVKTKSSSSSTKLTSPTYLPGKGVEGFFEHETWRLGSAAWMKECGVKKIPKLSTSGALLCRGAEVIAFFSIEDFMPDSSRVLINYLKKKNDCLITILSGDNQHAVDSIGQALNLPLQQCIGDLSPEQKQVFVQESEKPVIMIGDGVNDSGAMRKATLSVGIGEGLQGVTDNADVFICARNPVLIHHLFEGAHRTALLIRRGLIFSIIYNIVGIIAAILGYVSPLLAAIVMPLSSLAVITNAVISKSFVREE